MKKYTFNRGMLHLWLPQKILLIMRLVIVLLTTCLMQVSAASFAQKLTYSKKGTSLEEIFAAIEQQTGYNVFYSASQINSAKKIDVNFQNADLTEVLETLARERNLAYTIDDKNISIKLKEPTFLEGLANRWAAIDVHGRVVDQEGKPLSGATVKIKSSGKSVSTNAKGEFYLEKVDEEAVLVISFIGYVSKEVDAGKEMGNIVLEVNDSKLDEIQVIAYGTTTRRLSTGNVTSVKAEDIAKAPVANPLLAIAGRVPGLLIQQATGVPGSGVKVQVQGQNSMLNGNDPFYVVDGVPYTAQMMPGLGDAILGTSGGPAINLAPRTGGNPLSYINPADIESIDVLKDADATSIYGSRAANGAIIITTKRGKAGKTAINLNAQQGGGAIARRQSLLNTAQYLQVRKEALANDGITLDSSNFFAQLQNADLLLWSQTNNTDWQKILLGGVAKYTNLSASVSGGTLNTQYLVSAGYQRDGTVTPGDLQDQKASLHFNLSGTSENRRFRLSLSGSYIYDNNQLAQLNDFTVAAFSLPPNAPALYNSDGSLNWAPLSNGYPSWINPLAALNRQYINKTGNLIANLVLGYQLAEGMEFKSSFGYNTLQTNEVSTAPFSAIAPYLHSFQNRTTNFNAASVNSWIIEPQLTYQKRLGPGKLDFLLGSTIQQENRDRQQLDASGFSSDASMMNIKAAATVVVNAAPNAVILSTYKYNALFSRLNYNLSDKYLFTASVRRDGSSRFGAENRFHDFWSLAGAWIFSDERWTKEHLSFLSFAKLRASYGTTGNDQIGDYSYLNLYGNVSANGSSYQGIIGLQPSGNFPNPYLQWEETRKASSAIDLGFLKDRILLNLTYFRNRSSNQLAGVQLPSITGGTSVTENRPIVVQNTGWELSLNTSNLVIKTFRWTSTLNLTIPRNKLVQYNDYDAAVKNDLVGRSLNTIKLYHFLGVDPLTGLYIVSDHKGNPTSNPVPVKDQTVFVDRNPKYYGGLINSFSYKGFSLDILIQFVNQRVAGSYKFGNTGPGTSKNNQPTSVLERWQKEGDQVAIQKYNSTGSLSSQWNMTAYHSDVAYQYGSYARVRNVSLSWHLSSPWLARAHLQQARIYAQGQNLWSVTSYKGADPESQNGFGIPPLRVFTLGLQVGL